VQLTKENVYRGNGSKAYENQQTFHELYTLSSRAPLFCQPSDGYLPILILLRGSKLETG
jgi:hypothetical protein